MITRALPAIILAAAVGMLATGCAAGSSTSRGSSTSDKPSISPPARSPSAAVPAVARICGPPNAPGRLITLRAADGVRLAGITTGTGPRGVVLIPELGVEGKCGWWEFAALLAAQGYRVVTFDHRCTGQSACAAGSAGSDLMSDIRGAVTWLRQHGAARVALVGASQGASEALIAGTQPMRDVTGIAALSADELALTLAAPPYAPTAIAATPHLHLPTLFAVAAADPYVSVQATRSLFARAASASKRLVVLSAGSGHGWDLVTPDLPGGRPPKFTGAVLEFLREVTA